SQAGFADEGIENGELAAVLALILDETAAEYIRDRYRDNPVLPIPGFEVCGVTGEVIADAEAAWPETKECILTDDEDKPAVEAAGWTVITPTGPSNGANHE
ncbi:MAG: hypothetical protein KAJ98_08215, partial [Spirochaetaceae bacterium]|nr:hypothetical protein [Spirochaetaceae bacterium]